MSTEICVPIPHSLTVIKFQESQYTFPESRQVCVTVENMGGPAQTAFTISYSFGMCMANTLRAVMFAINCGFVLIILRCF